MRRGRRFMAIIAIMSLGLAHVGLQEAGESEGRVDIRQAKLSADGILEMTLALVSKKERAYYSWKGHVYPLLRFGLFVNVTSEDERELLTENVDVLMPKLHPRDVVHAQEYEYKEPLRLRVIGADGEPYRKCIQVKVTYDPTKLRYRPEHLSMIRLESDRVRVCPDV